MKPHYPIPPPPETPYDYGNETVWGKYWRTSIERGCSIIVTPAGAYKQQTGEGTKQLAIVVIGVLLIAIVAAIYGLNC